MQLGAYALEITGKIDAGGYVHMRHSEEYSVRMHNQSGKRIEAELRIDGEHVGTWRLGPYQTAQIERPANVAKKFAFYASNSHEGMTVGAAMVAQQNRGVVGVTFYPEKQAEPQVYRHPQWTYTADSNQTLSYGGNTMRNAPISKGLESGVTGLTGHSNQSFGSVAALQRDYANAITIELRLVIGEQSDPQPLPGRQRKISAPPPID